MKHVRRLPLLLIAALVATTVFATTASAQEFVDSSGTPYIGPFDGFRESGIWEGAVGIACGTDSTIAGEITDAHDPAQGTLTINLVDCGSPFGDCEVVTNDDQPLDFHVEGMNATTDTGHIVVEDAIHTQVECGGHLISCEFEAGAGSFEGIVTGGDPVEASFVDQPFTGPGGLCGDMVTATSHFIVDEPAGGLFID